MAPLPATLRYSRIRNGAARPAERPIAGFAAFDYLIRRFLSFPILAAVAELIVGVILVAIATAPEPRARLRGPGVARSSRRRGDRAGLSPHPHSVTTSGTMVTWGHLAQVNTIIASIDANFTYNNGRAHPSGHYLKFLAHLRTPSERHPWWRLGSVSRRGRHLA